MRTEALKSLGKVVCYILLPIIFLLVPTSWFETRRSLCLIRNVFGVKCPGCGMTRAISCIFHGNLKKALQYNRLVVIVFPLLCFAWLEALMTEYQRYRS
jgi:Protein of unknown function (DUF2752)